MPDQPTYDLAALRDEWTTYNHLRANYPNIAPPDTDTAVLALIAVVEAAQFLPEFLASNHCPECWHEGYAIGRHNPDGCPFGALVEALAPFEKETT